jgi:pimeloyl-ACP methyl ester carboxylesterase
MRFVLIHGGFHGAWCWSRTIPELEKLGHPAIAIDLPGHGLRRDERSTLADRTAAIVEVLAPGDVLVGHSGGGYDISLAAGAVPERIGHLVYLAAGLPIEGRSVMEATGGAPPSDDGVTQLMSDETGMLGFIRPDARGRMVCADRAGAADFFYHDCDPQTVAWAFDLLTPAPIEFLQETVSIPRFWAADLPRSYIGCREDRAKPQAMTEQVIDRLGVEPLFMDGSHSPFLSRPAELAQMLVEATATRPVRPLKPA